MEIVYVPSKQSFLLVAPLAGAWIEIRMEQWCHGIRRVAPLAGAWIEICKRVSAASSNPVAPLAGAWIEITLTKNTKAAGKGRSPRGSVD